MGIIWAFIQPLAMLLILWFVFDVGFKQKPINDVPFIIWLSTAYIPWVFFAGSINSSTFSILSNKFLIKQINFRVSILPIVSVFSEWMLHIFFLLMLFVMLLLYEIPINLYSLQVFYYMFAMIVLLLGSGWLLSSVNVFSKDVGHIIGIFVQFGFWLTPIFWKIEFVPESYRWIVKLNPMFYIIEGYRDSLINQVWFWEHPVRSCYFWIVTSIIFVVGVLAFKKLRPHFTDVL